MSNNVINRLEELKGNVTMLMPLLALPQYVSFPDQKDNDAFLRTIETLARHYYFLGELAIEDIREIKKHPDIGKKSLKLLSQAMGKFDCDMYQVQVYNHRSALKSIKGTSLHPEHGTARKDKVRDFLNDLFDIKVGNTKKLGDLKSGGIDACGNLVMHFNMSATLTDELENAQISNTDIEKTVNGSLKREIRRAYLKATKSTHITDDVAHRYDSERATYVELKDNSMKVTIPLKHTINGAFKDGDLNSKMIETDIKKELDYGIRLAVAVKNIS